MSLETQYIYYRAALLTLHTITYPWRVRDYYL